MYVMDENDYNGDDDNDGDDDDQDPFSNWWCTYVVTENNNQWIFP